MLTEWPELASIRDQLDVEKLWPWRHVVIHHSGTSWGNAERFGKFHREERGWEGLAYHFVIGNGSNSGDGEVEVGYRWKEQKRGAHAGVDEYNRYGVGICLVGNFEETLPTPNQMRSLYRLVTYLLARCGMGPANIIRHRDIGDKLCPGKNFPFEEFVENLSRGGAFAGNP